MSAQSKLTFLATASNARPQPDGSIAPDALAWPGVVACSQRHERVRSNGVTVELTLVTACYQPEERALEALAGGPAFVRDGGRFRVVYLGEAEGRALLVLLWCPRIAVRSDGTRVTRLSCPLEVDRRSGLHVRAKAQLDRKLASASGIAALQRQTLISRGEIEKRLARLKRSQSEAMAIDRFAPPVLALDGVFLSRRIGEGREFGHLVACDPAHRLYCTLGLVDMGSKKHRRSREEVAQELAELLLALPHPDALLAIVTDQGKDIRPLLDCALERAAAENPAFARVIPVLDPFHVQLAFRETLERLRAEVAKQHRKNGATAKYARAQAARHDIEKSRWAAVSGNKARRTRLKQVFTDSPRLRDAYWLVEGVRQVLDCRTRAAAEARYQALCAEAARKDLAVFKSNLNNLREEWPNIRRTFEVLETLDRSLGEEFSVSCGPVEGLNRQAKAVWREARNSSLELIEGRLLARNGYRARALAVSAPTVGRRAPRKRVKTAAPVSGKAAPVQRQRGRGKQSRAATPAKKDGRPSGAPAAPEAGLEAGD